MRVRQPLNNLWMPTVEYKVEVSRNFGPKKLQKKDRE